MSAINKMVKYAESWLDIGVEYSRGQIIEGMVNKARELASEDDKMIDGQKAKQFICGLLAQLIKTEGDQKVCCEYNIAIDDAIEAIIFHFPIDKEVIK